MAQCNDCKAEIAVYERICPSCGADVKRTVISHSERWRARFCHLSALPGMFIFVVLAPVSFWFALLPLNLIVPLVYRLALSGSQTVRSHAVEVLNFQVLWTVAIFLTWSLYLLTEPPLDAYMWLVMWAVWLSGVSLVAFRVYDLGNSGDGRYPASIPLFRLIDLPNLGNRPGADANNQPAGQRGDGSDRERDESSIHHWQCSACNALVAAKERGCPYCRLGVRPDPDGPQSEKELSLAGWSHLLALPGMIFLFLMATGELGDFGFRFLLVPLNLVIPLAYWLWSWQSPFIRCHAAEMLNYQLLWIVVAYIVHLLGFAYDSFVLGFAFYAVLPAGVVPVLIAANDARNGGDGKYIVRIPLFK